jgi:Cell division protein CrgA
MDVASPRDLAPRAASSRATRLAIGSPFTAGGCVRLVGAPALNTSISEVPMPKSKVRKKSDFTVSGVSRTPVKVKAGPSSVWFVALFVGLMLIGLIWLMVFQLAATGPDAPSLLSWMANLGPWNYAVAFAFMISGLLLTMRWR